MCEWHPSCSCMSGRGPFSPLDFLVLLLRQAPTLMLAATLGLSLPSRTWMVALARVCVYFRAVVVLSLYALQAAGMGWGAVQLPAGQAQASHTVHDKSVAAQAARPSMSQPAHPLRKLPPAPQAVSTTPQHFLSLPLCWLPCR